MAHPHACCVEDSISYCGHDGRQYFFSSASRLFVDPLDDEWRDRGMFSKSQRLIRVPVEARHMRLPSRRYLQHIRPNSSCRARGDRSQRRKCTPNRRHDHGHGNQPGGRRRIELNRASRFSSWIFSGQLRADRQQMGLSRRGPVILFSLNRLWAEGQRAPPNATNCRGRPAGIKQGRKSPLSIF